ncbi:GT-D fold domain-containing glycosyltransferase [Paenibacillus sp. GCM10023250]|uniref:GT-D fold domain-containing glycosyltransferase n=1 Tax=Paenibacillus sp. GCM10023250 TaxID=3252648 RepID=UPI003607232A
MAIGVRLTIDQTLSRIARALKNKRPLSLVRIGDGENLVLAQASVWTQRRVMREKWAIQAKKGRKGIPFPSLKLRDQVAGAIRRADIVGILPAGDRRIKAPAYLKRPLTNQVFLHFGLAPQVTCHACFNRIAVRKARFRRMLRGKRILVITAKPGDVKAQLERKPYRLRVAATIPFSHYRQLGRTMSRVRALRSRFDIALISCGVSAVVLAPRIAEATGKVAVDFGKAPKLMQVGRGKRKRKQNRKRRRNRRQGRKKR